jgi:hypothetical protein
VGALENGKRIHGNFTFSEREIKDMFVYKYVISQAYTLKIVFRSRGASPNVIRIIQSRIMRWACMIARMRDMKNV